MNLTYIFDECQTETVLAKYPDQLKTLKAIIPLFEEEGLKSIELEDVIYDDSYNSDYIESMSWLVKFTDGRVCTLYLVRSTLYSPLKFWFHLPSLNDEDSPESDYWDLATLLPDHSGFLLNHHQIVLNWLD